MKYYSKENEELGEYRRPMVRDQAALETIVRKLCRHYKFEPIRITYNKQYPDTGTFWRVKGSWRPIRLDFHRTHFSILVVCHEVAHYFNFVRNRPGKCHTKKHKTWTKRLLRYCEKMEYWGLLRAV